MKKISALLLTGLMAFMCLTGFGDPLYDDFDNFLNTEMTGVNENYDKITEETGLWANFEEDAELESSLEDVLLPLVNDSIAQLEGISPATDEVKALKDKYSQIMSAYKEGFELILAGLREQDEEKMNAGTAKVEEGLAFLDEYNAGLESLAEEVGGEITY